jgi:hypothetical protein
LATSLEDIIDLFQMLQDDYKLTALYNTSVLNFNTYQEGWLLFAIREFRNCNQDLTYVKTSGSSLGYFVQDLTDENKEMLSQLMVKFWLQKELQNSLKMDNHIIDHDFKIHSAAENVKGKRENYEGKKEELDNALIRYGLKYNDWTDWNNQVYGG